MRMIVGVMIAAMAIIGMAAGFNGWDNSASYEQNVNAIFGAKDMNMAFDPINDTMNWTNGSKPINKFDAVPYVESEQDQIDAKVDTFLGRVDPYAQPVLSNKPARGIDASWGGDNEQEMIDKKNAAFLE